MVPVSAGALIAGSGWQVPAHTVAAAAELAQNAVWTSGGSSPEGRPQRLNLHVFEVCDATTASTSFKLHQMLWLLQLRGQWRSHGTQTARRDGQQEVLCDS